MHSDHKLNSLKIVFTINSHLLAIQKLQEIWILRAGCTLTAGLYSSVGSHDYNKDACHLKSHIITMVLYKHHKYLVFQGLNKHYVVVISQTDQITGSVNHIYPKILKIHLYNRFLISSLAFKFGGFFFLLLLFVFLFFFCLIFRVLKESMKIWLMPRNSVRLMFPHRNMAECTLNHRVNKATSNL